MQKGWLKTLCKKTKKHIIEFVIGLMVAVIAALLFAVFSNSYNAMQQEKSKNDLITSLAVGTNEKYIEETLGMPYFKYNNTRTGFIDCIYKLDGAFLRIFFIHDSARAIILTISDKSSIGKYDSKEALFLSNNKKLGTFTFDDIEYINEGNFESYINGAGLSFYIEPYWTRPSGNYHFYILSVMPYGHFTTPDTMDNARANETHYNQVMGYMGNYYPNTIGIIDREYLIEVSAMLMDMDCFDYMAMRIYDQEMEDTYAENNETDQIGDLLFNEKPSWYRTELEVYEDKYYMDK